MIYFDRSQKYSVKDEPLSPEKTFENTDESK